MSAQILALPAPAPRRQGDIPRFAPAHPLRRYRLGDIARLLCMEDLERRTLIERLRKLHRLDGMPLPENPRVYGDRVLRGARSICAGSIWDAARFDAWRHRPDPAAPQSLSIEPPLPLCVRDEMRERAQRLAGERK